MRAYIKGMDAVIRKFDRSQEDIEEALDDGCLEAAEYLQEKMENKFGVYQTGWAKLKANTIYKERKMYGSNADKPLVMSGDMMFSLVTDTSNKTRKHTVAIQSDDEKLIHHVYGAPRAGVPKRDPIRPTTIEERDNCVEIVIDAVRRRLFNGKS